LTAKPKVRDTSGRVLRIAIIAAAVIEAIAMVPLIIHLANK
jgi:hypothetical protein